MVVLGWTIAYAGNGFPPALFVNFAALAIPIGDKRAPAALVCMIDRKQKGYVALADSSVPVNYITGISDNLVTSRLPETAISSLSTYQLDLEKAATLFQEAGWTKDGSERKTPEGDIAQFELSIPAEYADWSAAGQNTSDQLTMFGNAVKPRAITFNQ